MYLKQFNQQLERFLEEIYEEIEENKKWKSISNTKDQDIDGIDIDLKEHIRVTREFLQMISSGKVRTRKGIRKKIRKKKRKNNEKIDNLVEDVYDEHFYKLMGTDCCLNDIRNLVNKRRYIRKEP